jgi:hypothetical protein
MGDRKTIVVNPDLFKLPSTNTTRRRRRDENGQPKPLRMRVPGREYNKTNRSHLIRQIRNMQEARAKQMLESGARAPSSITPAIPAVSGEESFHSDFEDSLNYLNSIAEKAKRSAPTSHTSTVKHYPSYDPGASSGFYDQVDLGIPDVFSEIQPSPKSPPIQLRSPSGMPTQAPPYSSMKNGSKPTFRYWRNQTQKNTPPPPSLGQSLGQSLMQPRPAPVWTSAPRPQVDTIEFYKEREQQRKERRVRPRAPPKQKRTLTRTFFLGKSKHYPRVGVLVSNKTIRKETSQKIQKLRQTPIEEVRRTLIRKGLIKVGSPAPNDVLRKMYESMSLLCGELNNHNPETLLYNYLNADVF